MTLSFNTAVSHRPLKQATFRLPTLDVESVRWYLSLDLYDMVLALKGFDLSRIHEEVAERVLELSLGRRSAATLQETEERNLNRRLALRLRTVQEFHDRFDVPRSIN